MKNLCPLGAQSDRERRSQARDLAAARLAAKVNLGQLTLEQVMHKLNLRDLSNAQRKDMQVRVLKYINNKAI